jgi:predicted RNA-binding Zn-ribbon protein involved in translation (DUF1610 family)
MVTVGDFFDQRHSADDDWTCPKCGTPVPMPEGRTAYTSGTGTEIALQPRRQQAECPNPECGAALIREADPPSPWRVDDRAE